jgi:hypothetical protein
MQATVDFSDGDLARAVAARRPGSAEAAESEWLQLTLASTGAARAELGRYVLEHSALAPPA